MAHSTRERPYVRSFSFDEGEQRVAGGSAVTIGSPFDGIAEEPEDFGWSKAQTEAFLAGEPLTLRFSTQAPEQPGSKRVYVCCWITLGAQ